MVEWLAGEGIIAAGLAGYVLGAGSGYPPGPRYARAVIEPGEWLWGLRANGVEACACRNVFRPGQWRGRAYCLPAMRAGGGAGRPATGQMGPHWERFGDALDAWMAGGAAAVACPACGQVAGFNDWRWPSYWPFAVGCVGFTFWNWPELREAFVGQVASLLGHRVVVTRGKL